MAFLELAFIILGLTLLYWWFYNRKSSLSAFPGPPALPFLGNIHQINLQASHFTLMAWQKQYGGMFKIKVLGKESLVVSSYETIYEVLVTKGADFAGRTHTFRLRYFTYGCKDIALGKPDKKWNLLRKTAHKQLKMFDKGWLRLENITMDIINDLVGTFRNHKDKSFDPKPAIYNAAMNMIALIIVGKKVTSEELQMFITCEQLLFECLIHNGWGVELDIFPWLKYFGNPTFRKLQQFIKIYEELYNILKQHVLETLKKEPSESEGLLHALMRLYLSRTDEDKMSPVGIDEDNVKATALDLIFAGTSTTTATFYCYMKLISHHQDVQRKLQEEVDEKIGFSRSVSLTNRSNMPYTCATVLELLRFSSVLALGVPHKAIRDTTIRGKCIPAGTEVFTNLYALHHDEGFWDRPFEFRPDRFLEENGELLSPSREERRHLMPFGAGPRVCLGEVLAKNRLFLLIATMSQVFEVRASSIDVSYDSRDYDSGSLQCQKKYEIYLETRNNKLFQAKYE